MAHECIGVGVGGFDKHFALCRRLVVNPHVGRIFDHKGRQRVVEAFDEVHRKNKHRNAKRHPQTANQRLLVTAKEVRKRNEIQYVAAELHAELRAGFRR